MGGTEWSGVEGVEGRLVGDQEELHPLPAEDDWWPGESAHC